MAAYEVYPVVITALLWSSSWSGKRVLIFCKKNLAAIYTFFSRFFVAFYAVSSGSPRVINEPTSTPNHRPPVTVHLLAKLVAQNRARSLPLQLGQTRSCMLLGYLRSPPDLCQHSCLAGIPRCTLSSVPPALPAQSHYNQEKLAGLTRPMSVSYFLQLSDQELVNGAIGAWNVEIDNWNTIEDWLCKFGHLWFD